MTAGGIVHVTEAVDVDGGVVVGDDGSEAAVAALAWAADDAIRRGGALHVVRCWSLSTAPRPESWEPGYVPALNEWEAAVLRTLAEECAPLAESGVDLHLHAVHGRPGPALVRASAGADLVVVGSRGRREITELLLGSVADHVVRHARCPVVVVHPRPPEGA